MRKPQTMFAFTSDTWNGYLTCVHHLASDVRREMGESWKPEDWRGGWKIVRKRGGRVVKIIVREHP